MEKWFADSGFDLPALSEWQPRKFGGGESTNGVPLNNASSSSSRTYLEVPFTQNEVAKALGAKWDGDNKKWFVDCRFQQMSCSQKCGRASNVGFTTCCQGCPAHTAACAFRQLCSGGCGRLPNPRFQTCCQGCPMHTDACDRRQACTKALSAWLPVEDESLEKKGWRSS